jgi:hypothetical protein
MKYTENILYFPYVLTSLLKLKVEDSGTLSLKLEVGFKCSQWLDQNSTCEKGWKWRLENGD